MTVPDLMQAVKDQHVEVSVQAKWSFKGWTREVVVEADVLNRFGVKLGRLYLDVDTLDVLSFSPYNDSPYRDTLVVVEAMGQCETIEK